MFAVLVTVSVLAALTHVLQRASDRERETMRPDAVRMSSDSPRHGRIGLVLQGLFVGE